MNRFTTLSRFSKKAKIAVAVLLAVAVPTISFASWSPQRPTYTMQSPAPHVTFNSITDNPNYGDERTFFDVKSAANTSTGGFTDTMSVSNGQELLLRTYVHNNAASNLNGANFTGTGVADDTKVRVLIPTGTSNALRSISYVSSSDATPGTVSDTIDLSGNKAFKLDYVEGSAKAYTNAVPAGYAVNDSIVASGAPVGYTGPNGKMPGCLQYAAIVTIKVKVVMPEHTIEKSVRLKGQGPSDWKESVTAKPGDEVEWRIQFKNTGGTQLDDVKIVDALPNGMSVVPNTVELVNSNNPNGFKYGANAVQGRQINVDIGDYGAGSNAFLYFFTKVDQPATDECETITRINKAYATPQGQPTVVDDAQVVVDTEQECEEPFSFKCEGLTAVRVGGKKSREYKFTATAQTQGDVEIKQYVFTFGDDEDATVTANTVNHTYDAPGTYTATAKIITDKGTTQDICKVKIVIKETPEKPEVPEKPAKELPNTGPGEMLLGAFGTGTLGTAARSWYRSKRELKSKLLNR
jgi:uncharacterized repeat protein (TIGR01451 family)